MEGVDGLRARPAPLPVGGVSEFAHLTPQQAEQRYDSMMAMAARHHDVLNASIVMSVRFRGDPVRRASALDRAISAMEQELVYIRRARAAYGVAHQKLNLPDAPESIIPGLSASGQIRTGGVVGGKLPPPKAI